MGKKDCKKKCDFFLFLFAITELISKIFIPSEDIANAIIAGAGLICLTMVLWKYSFIKNGLLKIGIVFSILLLINILITGNSKISHLLWIWGYIGVSALLYSNGLQRKTSIVLFLVYTLFFLYEALIKKESVADDLMEHGSSNNISVMYIFGISLYYLTIYRTNASKRMPYIPAIILGCLSIWAANRSGLLCALFLICLIIIYNLMNKQTNFKYNVFLLLIFSIILVTLYDVFMGKFGVNFLQKEEQYGTETTRTLIWSQYFQACMENPLYLLFGVSSSDSSVYWFHYYSGNAHNAFIMAHSKFGLGGLFIILAAIVQFYINAIRKKMYPLIIVFSTIVLRSVFDWTGFLGLFDVFFYYIMFELKYNKILKNLNLTNA